MMRRLLTGLLGVTLLLGGCGDDDGDDRSAVTSIPDRTTTSSTTTSKPPVPPPDVIPEDVSLITEEYVEAVLDALYEVSLEAALIARGTGFVEEPTIQRIEATSTEPSATSRINSLLNDVADGFDSYVDNPRPVDASVVQVIEADRQCIFAEVDYDSSGVTGQPTTATGFRVFTRLLAATQEQLTSGLNPTAWALDELPATDDGTVPERTCD